jgi:hypothetical protein
MNMLIPFLQGFLFTIGAFIQVAWPALIIGGIFYWIRHR